MTTAYERAIKGSVREMWKDGELVGEIRQPSDRLLVYLLNRVAPAGVHNAGDQWSRMMNWSAAAGTALDTSLAALTDSDVPIERLMPFSYQPTPLANGRETLSDPLLAAEPGDRPRDAR